MMLILRKHMWIVAVTMLLAVAVGATGGYLLGRAHVLQAARDALLQDAVQSETLLRSGVDESHALLQVLNRSSYPPCSDAEIAYFRQLIFRAEKMRDAGRMVDGRLQCSAVFGREGLPKEQFKPSHIYLDGTRIFVDLTPYAIVDAKIFSRQLGSFFVVEDPHFSVLIDRMRKDHGILTTNVARQPNGYPFGFTPKVPGVIADRESQGVLEDTLFATHCTPESFLCLTSYASISASLAGEWPLLTLDSALGGLSGAFLVMIYVVLYQRNRGMSQQLRRAIHNDKLRLVYQPVVELDSRRIVGAEALVRWTDDDSFAVSPEVFVRTAEELGFVDQLTALVVRHALRDFRGILRARTDFQLNINVTASDLADSKFLTMLEHALSEAGVAPQSFGIEVTESSTARKQIAREAIQELRKRGHSVLIDDFGTGYSSLAYLHDLDAGAIKIDRAFTHTIGTEAVTAGILPQILAMAATLDLLVVVEGIETEEQAGYFAGQERPLLGQGWLFGRPLPAEEFLRMLDAPEYLVVAPAGKI
jgi:sensor c-di-GMP phosphodiesterase-like protein